MVSGQMVFTTSSTISEDLRVATLGALSEICFLKARMALSSFLGRFACHAAREFSLLGA